MCKKPYPDLIHKKPEKNVTTHGYKKYPWSLCSSKILRIQPVTEKFLKWNENIHTSDEKLSIQYKFHYIMQQNYYFNH